MTGINWIHLGIRAIGGGAVLCALVLLILAPLIGDSLFGKLWGVEPFTYIGMIILAVGLGVAGASYVVPAAIGRWRGDGREKDLVDQQWSQVTQRYFDLFDHDLSRPLRRILGKQRELRAVLQANGDAGSPGVNELLDEIERQAPNFRLMISNIRVLVQLEGPNNLERSEPVEASEVVRKIVDRYTPVAAELNKEITWWSEPQEFGIVYSDSSAIEHIVVNLVDNAVRHASNRVELKLSKNSSHFFVRIWDDGPGIAASYLPHIFDHGWTPEVARREEKSSSGLGLFIARSLAKNFGGDITVESASAPDSDRHTAFLLGLPLGRV